MSTENKRQEIVNFLKEFTLTKENILDPQDFRDVEKGIKYFNENKLNEVAIYNIEDLGEDFINFQIKGLIGTFVCGKDENGDIEIIQWDTPEPHKDIKPFLMINWLEDEIGWYGSEEEKKDWNKKFFLEEFKKDIRDFGTNEEFLKIVLERNEGLNIDDQTIKKVFYITKRIAQIKFDEIYSFEEYLLDGRVFNGGGAYSDISYDYGNEINFTEKVSAMDREGDFIFSSNGSPIEFELTKKIGIDEYLNYLIDEETYFLEFDEDKLRRGLEREAEKEGYILIEDEDDSYFENSAFAKIDSNFVDLIGRDELIMNIIFYVWPLREMEDKYEALSYIQGDFLKGGNCAPSEKITEQIMDYARTLTIDEVKELYEKIGASWCDDYAIPMK